MCYYNFSDLIIRLKWAYKSHYGSIKVKKNKFTIKFLYLLQKIGLIRGFFFLLDENNILVYLKYHNGVGCIYDINVISKPSKRIYWTLSFLSKNYRRQDFSTIYIISTSKGLVTHNDVILSKNFSGEIICKIKI
jgi:ribosomal protein S8